MIMLTTDKNPLKQVRRSLMKIIQLAATCSTWWITVAKTEDCESNNEIRKTDYKTKMLISLSRTKDQRCNERWLIPIADWREAGIRPPVDFLVQGSRVRAVTRRERAALQVTMMVLVDMQVGPVYLIMWVQVTHNTSATQDSSQKCSAWKDFRLNAKFSLNICYFQVTLYNKWIFARYPLWQINTNIFKSPCKPSEYLLGTPHDK